MILDLEEEYTKKGLTIFSEHFNDLEFQEEELIKSLNKLGKRERGIVIKALEFASEKHKGQYRPDVYRSPYIIHVIRVCRILIEEAGITDTEIVISTLLHDVIEDCRVTEKDLEKQFGKKVTTLVKSVSQNSFPSRKSYMLHFKKASKETKLMKICDRVDNLYSLLDKTLWKNKMILDYVTETEKYVLPIAKVAPNLFQLLRQSVIDLKNICGSGRI